MPVFYDYYLLHSFYFYQLVTPLALPHLRLIWICEYRGILNCWPSDLGLHTRIDVLRTIEYAGTRSIDTCISYESQKSLAVNIWVATPLRLCKIAWRE